ncbi:ATP-binding cassette domain-containing protein [soil metagenome]
MLIDLQKIVPVYFEQGKMNGSEVWNKPLSFNSGEHVHIVAPSGSGKTSLIHFLYGLRNDYIGTVNYDGKDIKEFSAEKFASFRQKNISVVFQDLRLFIDQTVLENLELKRQLQPFHPESKMAEMADRLGISSKLHKTIRTCSYGEQQRVAIIRSLMQPFDFLLLDEPFSNLDENNRQKALDLIDEECKARNASMIFADLKMNPFFEGHKILHL